MLLKRVIPGAKTSNPTPIVVSSTPNEVMAKFPEWIFSMHPSYMVGGINAINMAKGTLPDTTNVHEATAFPNGAPAFNKTPAPIGNLAYVDTDIPTNNLSLFFVTQADDLGLSWSGSIGVAGMTGSDGGNTKPLRLLFNTNSKQFAWYNTTTSRCMGGPSLAEDTNPHLWMAVLSSVNGIVLYRDGQVIAQAPSETDGIDAGLYPGKTILMGNRPGVFTTEDAYLLVSETHLVGRDLSIPENLPHRLNIEKYMMETYGVITA